MQDLSLLLFLGKFLSSSAVWGPSCPPPPPPLFSPPFFWKSVGLSPGWENRTYISFHSSSLTALVFMRLRVAVSGRTDHQQLPIASYVRAVFFLSTADPPPADMRMLMKLMDQHSGARVRRGKFDTTETRIWRHLRSSAFAVNVEVKFYLKPRRFTLGTIYVMRVNASISKCRG